MKSLNLKIALLLFPFLWSATTGLAQDQPAETTTAVVVQEVVDKGPEDALNRGTPRGSIIGYLEASADLDFEKAAQFLDMRNLPDEVEEIGGSELARQLNHVFSRAVWLDDYTVSDSPEGVKGDGLPTYRDQLVVIKTKDGDVPLWMQHVPRGDGENIWKVSNRSVALIPKLYDEYSYPPAIEKIRTWFPEDASFLGFEAFKWFIMLASAFISWPVFYLFARILVRLFIKQGSATYELWRKILTGPMVALGIIMVLSFIVQRLGAGAYAQEWMRAQTVNTIVLIWVVWSIANLVKAHKQEKLIALGRPGAARLMQPITTFVKLFVLLFAVLFWLNNIGVNISTVLAGLGVGGLALALALQKPIEDMMGALSLFSQAPIRVGDFCQYGGYTGTVEDIGLRSTRIRTLTNTLIHVPNARLAHVEIENFTAREKIRFWPTLRLRYDTTPEQLRQIKAGILETLEQHEEVYDDPLRVRLTDFDEDAILVKVHSFMKTTDFPESLRIAEDLNFQIMEIIHGAGAQFALPGRSIQIESAVSESGHTSPGA
jgi:MscS family membrane protein